MIPQDHALLAEQARESLGIHCYQLGNEESIALRFKLLRVAS